MQWETSQLENHSKFHPILHRIHSAAHHHSHSTCPCMFHANHLDHHIIHHHQHGARWNDPFLWGMTFHGDFDDWTA